MADDLQLKLEELEVAKRELHTLLDRYKHEYNDYTISADAKEWLMFEIKGSERWVNDINTQIELIYAKKFLRRFEVPVNSMRNRLSQRLRDAVIAGDKQAVETIKSQIKEFYETIFKAYTKITVV
jgi:hypothetical protein